MKSLDALVREHLPAAVRLAYRLTGDSDLADDLVQEALLKVARSWLSFRRESTFRTWLFRIVINTFRDQQRRRAPPSLLDHDPVDRKGTMALDGLLLEELTQQVNERAEKLPPRQREVFVLIVFEEMTARETAKVLGITEANVHSTLRLVRNALRPLVEDSELTRTVRQVKNE
jgi:RNA polymerase sigma-70 factor (ECF subfamily)